MSDHTGPGDKNDSTILVGVFIALILVCLLVIWYIFHTELSIAAIHAAFYSLPVLTMIAKSMIAMGLPEIVINAVIPIDVIKQIPILKETLLRQDPRQVDLPFFGLLLEITGYSFRLLLPFITGGAIYYVIKRSKAARLKRTMNIFELAKTTSATFPQIRPAIIENLINIHPDKGEFRREESPIRFCIQKGLIKTYDIDFRGDNLKTISKPTFDKKLVDKKNGVYFVIDDLANEIAKLHGRCILDSVGLEKVFVDQLGDQFIGSDHLPPMIRGIYAGLIAFICTDKDEAMDLFAQFNHSWKTKTAITQGKAFKKGKSIKKSKSIKKGKSIKKEKIINKAHPESLIDLSKVDDFIEKYEAMPKIQNIINQHGYVTTLMQRLVREARTKGKFATSVILWLKPVDRTLWYCLNQEGGQCSWIESSGPRAHLLAELSAKGPIWSPFVEAAVAEGEYYLAESEGWIPKVKDNV
jgi:hypothetical protein